MGNDHIVAPPIVGQRSAPTPVYVWEMVESKQTCGTRHQVEWILALGLHAVGRRWKVSPVASTVQRRQLADLELRNSLRVVSECSDTSIDAKYSNGMLQ